MNIIHEDLLNITNGIICHQVNCKGVMGAGLALSIKTKYPIVYEKYKAIANKEMIGNCHIVKISKNFYIANLFGQKLYGNEKGIIYTDYKAFESAIEKLAKFAEIDNLEVYFPYGIGSGLGKGNISKINFIISKYLPTAILCIKPD